MREARSFLSRSGPLVDYHGIRQPMVGVIGPVLSHIRREAFPVWNLITDGGRLLERMELTKAA